MRCKRVYVLCVCVCVCGGGGGTFMDQYSFFMLISYGFLDRKAVKVAIQ